MLKAARGHFLPLLFLLVLSRDVLAGNDWIKIFNPQLCAVKGSSAPMFCSLLASAGRKINNVFWTVQSKEVEDPQDLAENPLYTGRVHYIWDKTNPSNDCTLNLTDVKQTDSTHYRVWILSDKGKRLSQTVTLSVMDLTVTVPTPVVEGDKVKLGCTQSCVLKEKPKVVWRKDGKDIDLKQYDNSELILQRVSPENEGDYSCALEGYEGHPSEPKKLNIMFSPKNTSVSVSSDVITHGITVTLTCSSDANPPVENYTWFKVNQSTPVESGQQYSISNIRSEDGGQYYCEARNKHGAENSSAVSITVAVSTTTTSTTTFHHTVMGSRSSVVYIVAGVSVCGAAGLLCMILCVRYRKTNAGPKKNKRSDKSGAAGASSAGGAHDDDDVQYSSVFIQRPGDSGAAGSARGAQDDVQYSSVFIQRPGDSRAAVSARGAHEDDVQYSSVFIQRPGDSRAAVSIRGAQDDVQYSSVFIQRPGDSRAAGSARGAQDDVQYSSVFIQGSGQDRAAVFAGGGEDDVQHSSIRWKHTGEPAGDYGKDVHHADVHFMGAAAVQGSSDRPEGELSVIYSGVQTRN